MLMTIWIVKGRSLSRCAGTYISIGAATGFELRRVVRTQHSASPVELKSVMHLL